MTSFLSEPRQIHATADTVTNFFGDIENFRSIMPEQIENWETDGQICMFTIKNLGRLAMQKGNFNEPHQYEFRSAPQSKVDFSLIFHLTDGKSGTYHGHFEILTEVNPLIEMMARRPLVNFVTILTENLQKRLGDSQK